MKRVNRNSLLIIGNGFDMSLGLDSSFTDFFGIKDSTYHILNSNLNEFINDCKNYDKNNKTVSSIKILENKNFLKIRGLNHTYYKNSNLNTMDKSNAKKLDDASSKFFNEYVYPLSFSSGNNFNFWALYFLLRKDEGLSNWSDVETEIHNFLMHKNADLYRIELYMSKYLGVETPTFTINNGRERASLNKMINLLYGQQAQSLHEFDINVLIYVLITCSSSKNSFSNVFQYKNIHNFQAFEHLLLSYLKKQLHEFEYDLNDYLLLCLKNYEKIYGFSYYDVGGQLLEQLASDSKFSLLNFNYTDPSHNKLKENEYKRNIHGILNKDHNSRISPIIGISDNKIEINNPIYTFTKNYRIMRLSCNDYNNILNNHINSIRFFGHSFDMEDRHYFYEIFKNYHVEDGNTQLIFYYKPYGNQTDDSGAINQINNVIDLFEGYFNGDSRQAVKFMDKLSIYGNLIISNINDKIKDNGELYAKFKKIQQINNEN